VVRGVDDVESRRWDWWAVLLLVMVSAALWAPRLAGPLDLRYDAGVYYISGKALAEGRGYRLLNEPGAIHAIQYPPLLPLYAAAHQWLVGTSDPAVAGRALRWSYAGLFLAYVLLAYAFLLRRVARAWALGGGLLVALHFQLTWLSDLLFAELPFALVTLLFLMGAERGQAARRPVAGIWATAAYLLRSAGIGVFAAWIADAVLRRHWRAVVARAAAALVPVIAWQLYIMQVQHGPEYRQPAYAYQRAPYQYYNVSYAENMSYLDTFAPERGRATVVELAERVGRNLARLSVDVGASVSVDAGWLRGVLLRLSERLKWAIPVAVADVLFAALALMCVLGQALLFRAGDRLVPMLWAASLLLIAITPWELQFGRYLMPLAPLSVLGLVTVLARLPSRVGRRAAGAAVGAVLLAQAAVLAFVFARQHPIVAAGDQRLFFYDDAWAAHDRAIAWLAGDAPPDAIVATSTPFRVYLTTGRRAVLPPFEADPAVAERLLDSVPVEYLMLDELGFVDVIRRYAAPVVEAFPSHWRLVYGAPTDAARIYRRVRRE
jgi:hypothetical protein